jgi:hypothetical protein
VFNEPPRPPSDGLRSPTSPTPQTAPGEGFPFKAPDEPPRKSSLSESLQATVRARSATDETPTGGTQPLNVAKLNATPKLGAPNLPTMSISLSDPDFASILNGIDNDPASPDSRITRSPQVGPLASFPSHAHAHTHPSSSPSRRLDPPLLRTRQASAESTTSVARFGADSAFAQIVAAVAEAKHTGKEKVEVDLSVLVGIVGEVEDVRETLLGLRDKYTGIKRTSQQYSQGLTVAGEEYDREVAMRRDLEAEISRLRAQVHGQTARLSVISGDERRAENMRRRSNDLANSLTGLEREMSRLKAQRDMTLAEVEELQKGGDVNTAESLSNRLETIKEQYREELEPLTAQREALQREIGELRETKEQFIEESTALAAKNEELAELNSQLSRQVENMQEAMARRNNPLFANAKRTHPSTSPSISSLATSATLQEVPEETARVVKVTKPEPQPIEAAPARRFKWYGYKSSKGPSEAGAGIAGISRPLQVITNGVSAVGTAGAAGLSVGERKGGMHRPSTEFGIREHAFQQHSTMRLTRCELCAEKMWGLQEVRCSCECARRRGPDAQRAGSCAIRSARKSCQRAVRASKGRARPSMRTGRCVS